MPHASPLNLKDELSAARELIDEALDKYCELPSAPERLSDAIRYSLMAPGKRMRPILLLWAAEACGCIDVTPILPAACAVEMIHAYSLIHDDLPAMDNDDLRRGRPTCHKEYDEATAILAGDALLTLAFEVLARDMQSPELAVRCCAELAKAAGWHGMVGGQLLDLSAEGRFPDEPAPLPNLQNLEAIHARKTGALIRVALRLGAIVAGANSSQVDALEGFGTRIGLAFQIADDLLDVEGTQETTGKRVGKDQKLGKMTFPTLCGIEESRQMAKTLIADARSLLLPFENAGAKLDALASYVVERNH